jgi:RimJ/RimL family protein N-acetyltransferase
MFGPELYSKRLALLPPTEECIPDYVRWLNDPRVVKTLNLRDENITYENQKDFLQRKSVQTDCILWSIYCEKKHIGNTALLAIDFDQMSAYHHYIIGEPDYWNQGFGEEGMWLRNNYAFQELGLKTLIGRAYDFNHPAQRVLLRLGYRECTSSKAASQGIREYILERQD